jgi:hypothetical protein
VERHQYARTRIPQFAYSRRAQSFRRFNLKVTPSALRFRGSHQAGHFRIYAACKSASRHTSPQRGNHTKLCAGPLSVGGQRTRQELQQAL